MKIIQFVLLSSVMAFSACKKQQENESTTQAVETLNKTKESKKQEIVNDKKEAVENVAEVAKTIPEDVSYLNVDLKGFNTDDINLADLRGNVIFLNHWGSWCPPCRREMPSIQALYDGYKDKVKFAMVATERRPGMLQQFMEKEKYTFPVYEPNSPMATKIKPQGGFPTTMILDKNGVIKAQHVGAADWNTPEVHKLLNELLSQK